MIAAFALASLIYPFAVLMVALTGPHSEYEREANRDSFKGGADQ